MTEFRNLSNKFLYGRGVQIVELIEKARMDATAAIRIESVRDQDPVEVFHLDTEKAPLDLLDRDRCLKFIALARSVFYLLITLGLSASVIFFIAHIQIQFENKNSFGVGFSSVMALVSLGLIGLAWKEASQPFRDTVSVLKYGYTQKTMAKMLAASTQVVGVGVNAIYAAKCLSLSEPTIALKEHPIEDVEYVSAVMRTATTESLVGMRLRRGVPLQEQMVRIRYEQNQEGKLCLADQIKAKTSYKCVERARLITAEDRRRMSELEATQEHNNEP